ncbi:MAG: hypothetical protein A2V89_01860 [Gammaproteobacteria bacterium RBG_16_37_9]|nr:MAG: hypothetical protein A2V89_01860 [Gammaproteobacteria bacterium RBG_16_37_9]
MISEFGQDMLSLISTELLNRFSFEKIRHTECAVVLIENGADFSLLVKAAHKEGKSLPPEILKAIEEAKEKSKKDAEEAEEHRPSAAL